MKIKKQRVEQYKHDNVCHSQSSCKMTINRHECTCYITWGKIKYQFIFRLLRIIYKYEESITVTVYT